MARGTLNSIDTDLPASLECPCEFSRGFGLVCSHSFAILTLYQVKRVVRSKHQGLRESLIRTRWLRRMNGQETHTSQSNMQASCDGSRRITVEEADAEFMDS